MPNESAHDLTSEALNHFNQIDTRNTGTLNFLDIMNYEKLGPEQKKVGQFLQDNYNAIRGMAGAETHSAANPDGDITKSELSYVNQLSSSDQSAVNSLLNTDKIRGGIGGAIIGGEAGIPLGVVALYGIPVSGPLALVVGLGIDASAAAAGAALGVKTNAAHDQQNLAAINKMGL